MSAADVQRMRLCRRQQQGYFDRPNQQHRLQHAASESSKRHSPCLGGLASWVRVSKSSSTEAAASLPALTAAAASCPIDDSSLCCWLVVSLPVLGLSWISEGRLALPALSYVGLQLMLVGLGAGNAVPPSSAVASELLTSGASSWSLLEGL